jgi:hypothetical protein
LQGSLERGLAFVNVTRHVLHHHDGVVHHEADGEDDRQQGEEVDGEPEGLHQEDAADKRYRDRHHRDEHRAERAEEEEDDDHDDQQGVAQGLEHFANGAVDIFGGVVGHTRLQAGRQVVLDRRHFRANALEHVDGVGVGQGPDPHEHGGLAREADLGVVVLGAERHVGDLPQAHDGAVLLAHRQAPELFHGAQVGVGGQVDLDERALAPAECGQEVVRRKRLAHLGRADVQGRHPLGFEPDPHGKGAAAEDVGPLHPGDGRQARLDDAREIVGDLVLLQDAGGEAQIGRGEFAVGRLDVDRGHLGLGRQIAPHLVDLGADLGQGLGGVEVEPQARLDGGKAEGALRLHVFDAVGRGDGALQRRGDEAAHQVGVGADVDGGDGDRGVLAARVLAHVEGADRLQAGDDDDQADHQGEDGTAYEEVGDVHGIHLYHRDTEAQRKSKSLFLQLTRKPLLHGFPLRSLCPLW